MSITFACHDCGRNLTAKDELAGKSVRCPQCGIRLAVPSLVEEVFAEEAEELEADQPKASRPFYKDPIVVIGALVPTVILVAFVAYLISQQSAQQYHDQIISMKAEAEKLESSGELRKAYTAYRKLNEFAKGRHTEDQALMAAIEDVKKRERDLGVKLQPIFEQETRAIEEQKRQEELAAKENARLAIAQREKEEREAKFAGIKGTVSGGAWTVNGLGQSSVLRGLDIYLIPASFTMKDVGIPVSLATKRVQGNQKTHERVIANDSSFKDNIYYIDLKSELEVAHSSLDVFNKTAVDEIVDARRIWSLCRDTNIGLISKIEKVTRDEIWPEFVADNKKMAASTNIDGKYTLSDVAGGDYYLYATTSTDNWVVEWLTPVTVEESKEYPIDLSPKIAVNIINKSDDD